MEIIFTIPGVLLLLAALYGMYQRFVLHQDVPKAVFMVEAIVLGTHLMWLIIVIAYQLAS